MTSASGSYESGNAMTDLSARNKRNKAKGSAFEVDARDYLRGREFTVDRLARTGRNDEGDLAVRLGDLAIVVECKNTRALDLSGFMREATIEALNYQAHRVHASNYPELAVGVSAIKRRNSSIEKTYLCIELGDFCDLLLHLSRR